MTRVATRPARGAARGPALACSGIDHVVLHVKDPAASKEFYMDVLGMTVHHEGAGYVFLRSGAQLLALFADDDPESRRGSDLNHLAFNVPSGSYEEIKGALEARGLEVRGRAGDPRCIYFDDPDGYTLQIVVPA